MATKLFSPLFDEAIAQGNNPPPPPAPLQQPAGGAAAGGGCSVSPSRGPYAPAGQNVLSVGILLLPLLSIALWIWRWTRKRRTVLP